MSNKQKNNSILYMILGTIYVISIIVCFAVTFITKSPVMIGVTIGLVVLLFVGIGVIYNYRIIKAYKEIDETISQASEEMRIDVKTSIKYKKIYIIAFVVFLLGFVGMALSIIFVGNSLMIYAFIAPCLVVAIVGFVLMSRASKKIKPVQYFISYLEYIAVKAEQKTELLEAEYAQLLQEQANKEPTDDN